MICHNEHRGAEPSTNIARVEDEEEVAQQMYCVYDVPDLLFWLDRLSIRRGHVL